MSAIPSSTLPGHRLLHERVVGALELCQESKSVEFKESASWETLRPKLVKTSLAMANLRGGGIVVIGVGERDGTWSLDGIQAAHLLTYEEDTINDQLNRFASPPIRVELVSVAHGHVEFLVVSVPEFQWSPVVCQRDGHDGILKTGAIYVRADGKPQTTSIARAGDLEHLLELAAEKRARRFLETAARLGMKATEGDTTKFDDELGGL